MISKLYSLIRRADMKIRRDIIRLLGLRAREIHFLESPIAEPRDDVKRIGIYAKAEKFTVPHLTHEGDSVTYSFTRRYIYEIPNAIIDPLTGMVYDQEGRYIPESMAWEVTRLLSEIPRPFIRAPARTLKGKYIFLPTTPTYYHWLIQDLPVLIGAYKQVPDAQIIVGANDFKPAQMFIKRFLGKNTTRQCFMPIRVEYLVMAAKDGGLGIPFPPIGSPNLEDIRVLQDWFKEDIDRTETSDMIKLYLSRSRWSRSHKGELLLEDALKKEGFIVFHGDLPFFEQIKLFSRAKIIVGASGAAMSNMIWARPGTRVIQLHLPKIYWNFYYNLGHICRHDYHFLEVPDHEWSKKDIESIVNKVKIFMKFED